MESSQLLSHKEKDMANNQPFTWLTPTDFSVYQAEYSKERTPGTCLWIPASQEYNTWILGNSHHTLLCSGKSGAGKTISASTVIQDLETRFLKDVSTGVAYIYFSTLRPGEQDLQNLMLCLIKQLVKGLPEVPDEVTRLKDIIKGYRVDFFDDVLRALYGAVKRRTRVYIVLDATDEYCLNSRNRFLREMSILQVKYGVKIFLTSTHVSEGTNRLKNTLKLEIRARVRDLHQYVSANMIRLPSSVQGSTEMKTQLISRIVDCSDERFLLAKLYLDLLARNVSPDAVLCRPSAPIPGFKAYDFEYAMIIQLVEHQSPEQVDLARRALSWLTYATRQLNISELQDALAIIKAGDFDAVPLSRPAAEDIITACCGLVILCPASGIIRLLHHTAQEYLSQPSKSWPQISESYLGETCVAYILSERFKDGICQNLNDYFERVRCSPLYEYAAKNWGKHLSKTLPLSQSTTTFLTDRPKVEAACQAAMKSHRPSYSSLSWMSLDVKMANDLLVAAFAGAEALVEVFLSRGMDVNTTDNLGNTPLAWAAQGGYEKIVELLLADQRTDMDRRNYKGHTPLLLAAKAGYDEVLGRLLKHGANPNLKDLKNGSPLWYAAETGHTGAVKLLLAQNLRDLNSLAGYKNYSRVTPLSIAVWNGHTEVVGVLLGQRGVDKDQTVNCKSDELLKQAVKMGDDELAEFLCNQTCVSGLDPINKEAAQTILHCAAKVGSEKIVRLLLTEHQVDPNCRTIGLLTPLMTAIEAGRNNELVLRLLLDAKGIKPALRDEKGRTALLLAASLGNESSVDIILASTTIDPHLKDDKGRTALSWAAEGLHEHIVEILLGIERIDPDNQDINGQTPLLYACFDPDKNAIKMRQRETVVRQLLATGRVNLNARGYERKTPVMMIAQTGNNALVRLFLSQPEIDLDATDADGANIVVAGLRGGWDIVELLLETGRFDLNYRIPKGKHGFSGDTILQVAIIYAPETTAIALLSKWCMETSIQDKEKSTVLASAVSWDRLGVVEKLLSMEGISPNLKNEGGRTPLSAAICRSSEKNADLLLKFNSVDPETEDRDGRTPLSFAAERGLVNIVKRLLSFSQVDPDSRDKTGRSPLAWAIYPRLHFHDKSDSTADGREEVVKQLLQTNEINLNAEDDEGWTPLGRAISDCRGDGILDLLLARKDVDLQHVDKKGRTFLSIAMSRGEPVLAQKVCGILGVSYDAKNSRDPTAMTVDDLLCEASDIPRSHRKRSPSPEYRSRTPDRYTKPDYVERITREYMTEARIKLAIQGEDDGVDVEDGKLCVRCEAIDLTNSFSHRPRELCGRLVAKLGHLDENWQPSSCGLCKLIAVVRPKVVANRHDEYELRAFSSTNIWLCENSGLCHEKLPGNLIDTVFLAVVTVNNQEFPSRLYHKPSPCETVLRSGFIARVGSNCSYQGRALSVRRVLNSRFDTSLTRSWITSCTEEHSTACNPLHTKLIPHLRLIHCVTREIVIPEGTVPPFTALSYVWGAVQGDQQDRITLEGHDVELVVEDAIRVTTSLGYEYLWVDRYCVTQIPGSIKDEQLRNMNIVYEGAEVTLVAAAGKDASFGLPGVSQRTRITQPAIKVQGHILTTIPPEPSRVVRSSEWATRGWTYQEGLLSRRRLYFTQYEVAYECREMLSREAIKLPTRIWERLASWEGRPRLQGSSWLFSRQGAVGSQEDGSRLFERLSEYTPRQLTRDSDILNAMLGIFQLYASLPEPVHHLCGVPIMTEDQDWEEEDNTKPVGFGSGLCWRLLHRAKRRCDFPSWSWTGWKSTVEPMGLVEYCENSTVSDSGLGTAMEISIVELDKRLLPWRDYAALSSDDKQSRFRQYHILQIQAFVVQVRLWEYYGNSDYWHASICIGDDVVEGYFELTKLDSEDSADGKEFHRRLLEENWLGILMGGNYILIVEEQQAVECWERVGIAHVDRDYQLNDHLISGLERRTILLG